MSSPQRRKKNLPLSSLIHESVPFVMSHLVYSPPIDTYRKFPEGPRWASNLPALRWQLHRCVAQTLSFKMEFENILLLCYNTWQNKTIGLTCRNLFLKGLETQQISKTKQYANGSVFAFYFVCRSSYVSLQIDWMAEKYEHAVTGNPKKSPGKM